MSLFFFFSSRRRHTRWTGDWSSDVCSSDLDVAHVGRNARQADIKGFQYVKMVLARQGRFARAAGVGDVGANDAAQGYQRSEERRVGKECRSRGARWR